MSGRIDTHAAAIVQISAAEGALDVVETQLLEIARAVDSNSALRERLGDIHMPVGQRLAFIESQALSAAHPATRSALALIISAELGGDLTDVARAVAQRAATSRDEELAEVSVAVALSDEQKAALKRALEQATGRTLDVKFFVDPSILGGVRAKIGDSVIDGSIAARLSEVRSRLSA